MKLIIGLGNPGKKYKNNRHNVGHMVVDKLVGVKALKTDGFMNASGIFVEKQVSKYKLHLEDLFVVFDDLDIKLGEIKIQLGKGPKDHNGLLDIYEKLGTKDFWHVRVGVENRVEDKRIPGEKYVLQDFTDEEKKVLEEVIKQICKKLEM
ncbi:aminoacyl-tRNA hydrolase [Candidatus Microgenomates bacterium]|nr:aminoacyl-tRNA hydrolase [Candidatus Microgenomates bacterium]